MREEYSPLNGEEKEEENSEKNFPEILWEEEFGEREIPSSREEMEEIREEFYGEILEWRNFHSRGNMGRNFLLPPEGMEEEIYEEIHSLILEEGIPFISYIQEFLHGMGREFPSLISSPEELKEDYYLFLENSE